MMIETFENPVLKCPEVGKVQLLTDCSHCDYYVGATGFPDGHYRVECNYPTFLKIACQRCGRIQTVSAERKSEYCYQCESEVRDG